MNAAAVLVALMALHRPSGPVHDCMANARHRRNVEAVADRGATDPGVPVAVTLAVARRESHWGCRGGRSWGAPDSRSHRFGRGSPRAAVLALHHSFRVCGSWRGAIGRFRSGLCTPWQRDHIDYVRSVMRDVAAIHEQFGAPPVDPAPTPPPIRDPVMLRRPSRHP